MFSLLANILILVNILLSDLFYFRFIYSCIFYSHIPSKSGMAFLRDSSVYCITNFTYPYPEKYIVGGICMLTSTVGFLGAALQIKSLWQYRNRQRRRPSPNPNIIFCLALSDLMACIGRYISYECNILYFLALLYILTKIIYACLELRIGCYCAMYTQNRSQSLVVQRSRLTSC